MSENTGRVFTVIGVIAVVYIAVRYVLPIVFKVVGFILTTVIYVGFFVLCAALLIYIIGKVVQTLRDRS